MSPRSSVERPMGAAAFEGERGAALAFRDGCGRWNSEGRRRFAAFASGQKQLVVALELGITPQMVGQIINGRVRPSLDLAAAIERLGIRMVDWCRAPSLPTMKVTLSRKAVHFAAPMPTIDPSTLSHASAQGERPMAGTKNESGLEAPNGPPATPETRVTKPSTTTVGSEVEGWVRGQELNRQTLEQNEKSKRERDAKNPKSSTVPLPFGPGKQ